MGIMRQFIIITSLVLLLSCTLCGQLSTREEPVSFKTNIPALSLNGKTHKIMPPLDTNKIRKEDSLRDANRLPLRFGYQHKVNYNLENSGEWTVLRCISNCRISTQMTQIKQIFTDRKNLCLSVASVLSVC